MIQFTPTLYAPTWSVEHLILHECSSQPRELTTLLQKARVRHAAHRSLTGRLTLSDHTQAALGRIVKAGHLKRVTGPDGSGYVLTPAGEARLQYLYETQVAEPYLKEVRRTAGALAEQQARRELL